MWQNINWREWKLVLKLDPDKKVKGEHLEQIAACPCVDGIIIGGTQNITRKNTEGLVSLVKAVGYRGPLIQEISDPESVSPEADAYLLPVVLNTLKRDWFIGKHLEAVKTFGHLIDWSLILPEAYIICNPECAAARVTQAIPPSLEDIKAYLTLAEEVFRFPIIYLEYSGAYGDAGWMRAIKNRGYKARVFYGGGIRSFPQAKEMLSLADTIVIGNIIYDNPPKTIEILEKLSVAERAGF